MLWVVDINVLSLASHSRRRLFVFWPMQYLSWNIYQCDCQSSCGSTEWKPSGIDNVMTKQIVNNKTDTRKIRYKSKCFLCVPNASICLNLSFLPRENQGTPKFTKFSYRDSLHFIFIPEFQNFRLRGSHFGNFEFLENSSKKFPHHLPPLRKFRLNEILKWNEIKNSSTPFNW